MSNVLDFFLKLKSVGKAGIGLLPQGMNEALLTEYLGPLMHKKLHQVHRARKKRGGSYES